MVGGRVFALPLTASEARQNRQNEMEMRTAIDMMVRTLLRRVDDTVEGAVWRSFTELEMYKNLDSCEEEEEEEMSGDEEMEETPPQPRGLEEPPRRVPAAVWKLMRGARRGRLGRTPTRNKRSAPRTSPEEPSVKRRKTHNAEPLPSTSLKSPKSPTEQTPSTSTPPRPRASDGLKSPPATQPLLDDDTDPTSIGDDVDDGVGVSGRQRQRQRTPRDMPPDLFGEL